MFANQTDLMVIDAGKVENVTAILHLVRSIFKQTFVIILHESAHQAQDLVKHGADYVINPGVEFEVLASIVGRCLERRLPTHAEDHNIYHKSGWKLDYAACVITSPENKHLKLTLTERDLLRVFFDSFENVCTFETIAGQLGIDPAESYRHRIEVIVSRLRRKFMKSLFVDLPLKSIRGVGYTFSSHKIETRRAVHEMHAAS